MSKENFDLGIVYFDEPDTSGHRFGPDDARLVPVIERMDIILGTMIQGLDNAGLKVCVHSPSFPPDLLRTAAFDKS